MSLTTVQALVKELAVPVPCCSTRGGRYRRIDFISSHTEHFLLCAAGVGLRTHREWVTVANPWLTGSCLEMIGCPKGTMGYVVVVKWAIFVFTWIWTIQEVFPFFPANFRVCVRTFITPPPLGAAKWFLAASSRDCFIQTCFHNSNIWLLQEKITHCGFKCTAGNIWRLSKLQFYRNCQATPLAAAPSGTLTTFF